MFYLCLLQVPIWYHFILDIVISFYGVYVASFFAGCQEFVTISLNKDDRIRLIHVPDKVIAIVNETVNLNWKKGVQEVIDTRPQLYEIKLRGTPWWADGMTFDYI